MARPEVMAAEALTHVDLFSRNLGRGKACDPCRTRKLRCDGVRPVCARCMEARNRRLDRMRRKGMTEEQLQATIFPPCFSLDREEKSPDDDQSDGNDSSIQTPASVSSILNHDQSRPSKQRRIERENGSQNDLFFAEILSSHLPMNVTSATSSSKSVEHDQDASQTDSLPPSSSLPTLRLPSDVGNLPAPGRLRFLVRVFLDTYPVHALFQPQRLLERLAKDPGDEDYPHSSVLHIILALTYAERPDLDESLSGPYQPHPRMGAHYRHTVAAQQAIATSTHHGSTSSGFFDIARALLLLCLKQYAFCDLLESYISNATAMRACIGLNFNKEFVSLEQQLMQQTLFPRIADGSFVARKPRDVIEAEEMRRTMLIAYVCDRTGCATTLWPGNLCEEDYCRSLPRTTLKEFLDGSIDDSVVNRPARHLNSPDFFTREPVDPELQQMKGSILMGNCGEFISRLPRDATKEYISSLPAFQRLESYITTMHLQNATLANPLGVSRSSSSVTALSVRLTSRTEPQLHDSTLFCSTSIPYACTLILHEPFANLSEESEAMCRGASRSIIAIIRLCSAHAQDEVMRLQVLFIFIVGLVGRSLIRQLESLYSKLIAHEFTQSGPQPAWDTTDFTASVSLLQADLEVVLLTLKRIGQKWPIGTQQHDTLLKLLQFNPEHRLRGLFCVN